MNKGRGLIPATLSSESVLAQGWNLLKEDIDLQSVVLYQDKILHNLKWMGRF